MQRKNWTALEDEWKKETCIAVMMYCCRNRGDCAMPLNMSVACLALRDRL